MNQFARCYAEQNPKRAAEILALPYLSSEQASRIQKALNPTEDCLEAAGAELRFKPPAMMGGMAEQLILSRFKPTDVLRLSGMTEGQAAASGIVPRNLPEDFAMCVVLKDAQSVHALIGTSTNSDRERTVVRQIAPKLGPCLVEGQSMSLHPASLRSILAVGLYRALSLLPPQGS